MPQCDMCGDERDHEDVFYFGKFALTVCKDCIEYAAQSLAPQTASGETWMSGRQRRTQKVAEVVDLTHLTKTLWLSADCRNEIAEAEERARSFARQERVDDAWEQLDAVEDAMRRAHWRIRSEIMWRCVRRQKPRLAEKLEGLARLNRCNHCKHEGTMRLVSAYYRDLTNIPYEPGNWHCHIVAACEDCEREIMLDFVDEQPAFLEPKKEDVQDES